MVTTFDSVHSRAMQDLATLIAGLSLTTDPTLAPVACNANVFVQMLPDESNALWPAVLITCEGEAEEESEYSTFEEDGVIYPVSIGIADRVSMRSQEMRPVYQSWRRQIMQTLRGLVSAPLLPSTTEAVDVRLKPRMIFDPRMREYQFLISGFTALIYTVEPRLRNTPS